MLGQGNQYRYILVDDIDTFPQAYIEMLIKDAYANSLAKVKDAKQVTEGRTIVKSIAPTKRPKKKSN